MSRYESGQIAFCQFEQSYGRSQAPFVFGVGWMLEIFLQVDKRAGGLDQSFKKTVVGRVTVEPKLLEHVVRFVVTLLIPATKIGSIKWVIRHLAAQVDIVTFQIADQLRNPLAFVHVGLNLTELRWAANLDASFFRRAELAVAVTNDAD